MSRRALILLAAALTLSACASHPGWTGTSRIPFDNAVARCQIETQTVDGDAFELCMTSLGWVRRSATR